MKKFITFFALLFFCVSAHSHKVSMNRNFRTAYKKNFPELYSKDPECLGSYFKIFEKYLTKTPVIFEAGGFDGSDTVRFASEFPDGLIITFEPNPDSFEKLKNRVQGFDNVWANQLAVNNVNGEVLFYVCHGTYGKDPSFAGASSVLKPTKNMEIHYMGPRIKVLCVKLDDWCAENRVDYIDFMWLDLEGLELRVLKGALEILKSVKIIYTETNMFMFRKGTVQYHELKSFLIKHGFKEVVHWFTPGLQGNAIFVREEIFEDFIK